MVTDFTPRIDDKCIQLFYSSGKLHEQLYQRHGSPANGWSRRVYYETGELQFLQSFSHSIVIEEILYDRRGIILAHKIYSHKIKRLIEKRRFWMCSHGFLLSTSSNSS
jgi:hypothetical protein